MIFTWEDASLIPQEQNVDAETARRRLRGVLEMTKHHPWESYDMTNTCKLACLFWSLTSARPLDRWAWRFALPGAPLEHHPAEWTPPCVFGAPRRRGGPLGSATDRYRQFRPFSGLAARPGLCRATGQAIDPVRLRWMAAGSEPQHRQGRNLAFLARAAARMEGQRIIYLIIVLARSEDLVSVHTF